MFLQCLYFCGQYQRALTLIKQDNLHKVRNSFKKKRKKLKILFSQKNLLFRYMAAKCHVSLKNFK
jgi:hypothetical protein